MKKIVGILAVAVMLASLATAHFWQQLTAERRQGDELARREAALKYTQPPQVAVPNPIGHVAPAALTTPKHAATPAAVTPTPANQQVAKAAANAPMKGLMDAMTTPEGLDAMRAELRTEMDHEYPDIEKELGISAEEKQHLFDLMSDPQGDSVSLMFGGPQDPAERREIQRKLAEAERDQQMKVSTLLGSRYPKWEDYQSQVQARQEVDNLRRMLSATDNPLSDLKSKELVTAIAAEHARAHKEERDWTASSAAINSPDMMKESIQRNMDSLGRLVDVAAPILDITQLDRFRQQISQQVTMLRATMGMMGMGDKP